MRTGRDNRGCAPLVWTILTFLALRYAYFLMVHPYARWW